MADFDVFNGDADGICSLVQLRLAEPRKASLITGVKRDIALLDRVKAVAGDRVTVLDISMEKNRSSLDILLQAEADVFYVDHHVAGDVPKSSRLTTIINEAPDVCTSLLVNSYLKGQFRAWAVVGAFGDNLKQSASRLAKSLQLKPDELKKLEELGTYLNYNGYGEQLEDLHFDPAELFKLTGSYANPLDFIRDDQQYFNCLSNGYHEDMMAAATVEAEQASDSTAVFILPNSPWARRISGVFSNDLANRFPARAHAIVTEKAKGGYQVSVRAPLLNKSGAAELCQKFSSGGGRAAAAGINQLSAAELEEFIRVFQAAYPLSAKTI
ncbi:MAG TPA: acetyltransferase [Oligella sp.]|nr:acetyltransferase [Oligella sp.]